MAQITRTESKDKISYYIRTNLVDENSGKRIRKSKTWVAPRGVSEAEARKLVEEAAHDFEKEVEESLFIGIQDSDYTVESYSKIYIDYVKKNYSPLNYIRIRDIFKYINSKIGNIKLKNLNPPRIQAYFDEVETDKRIVEKVMPLKNFKDTIKAYGFNYTILRRSLNIMHTSITRAYNGENVQLEWATNLCQKTKIPFDELFTFKKEITEYSYETKKKKKTYLRQMLAFAKRQRVIKENYATADFVSYGRNPNIKQIEAMDEDQAKKFYHALINEEDIRIKTSLLVFLFTGFRRGEVTALKWEDIDLDKRRITVNHSAIEVPHEGLIIKNPKTQKSQRTISIPQLLADQLSNYKAWQQILIKKFDIYKDEGFLFTKEDGNPICPTTFSFWLDKVLDKAELPHFTIHSLRHTNITLQILSGVPLVTVAGRAGHSRTSTTSDIYSHFVKSSDDGAAEKLEKTFGVEKEESNTGLDEILELKKEAKENGFNTLKEYIDYLKQSI